MRRLPAAAFAMTLLAGRASACPSCYGAGDSTMAAGMNYAILGMLIITGAVLGSIATFAFVVWRRHKKLTSPVSGQAFVDENGVLRHHIDQGVAEWKNY